MSEYHKPALLRESVEGLNIKPDGIYVDVTFGGGGHSLEILHALRNGRLYAFDQDEAAKRNLPNDKRIIFTHGNFRFLKNYMRYAGVKQIDGLLADLGVSSHHLDDAERGFSFRSDTGLDMRMNRQARLTAEFVVNEYETERLGKMFTEYGELREARRLAACIGQTRTDHRIYTTGQLIDCIGSLAPRKIENQFFAKVFQAIRIEVNRELGNLRDLLYGALDLLCPGGRLAIISYHSLEDRMVKNFMRWGNPDEEPVKDLYGRSPAPFNLIGRKPVMPNDEEIRLNPRARSARLRIAEKK
jgi:16S rRNA (cytosine1402-N4)-methyltransferase